MSKTSPTPDPRAAAVGRLILAAIGKSGLTQAEAARRANLHASNLSAVIAGRRNLKVAQLQALATALNCDIKDLMVAESADPATVHPTEPRLATVAEANAFDPKDPRPGAVWIQAVMADVQAGLKLQPGLAEYLETHQNDLTLAEAQLLAGHASKPMPGRVLVKDNTYWDRVLNFYRNEFAEALAKSRSSDGPGGD